MKSTFLYPKLFNLHLNKRDFETISMIFITFLLCFLKFKLDPLLCSLSKERSWSFNVVKVWSTPKLNSLFSYKYLIWFSTYFSVVSWQTSRFVSCEAFWEHFSEILKKYKFLMSAKYFTLHEHLSVCRLSYRTKIYNITEQSSHSRSITVTIMISVDIIPSYLATNHSTEEI